MIFLFCLVRKGKQKKRVTFCDLAKSNQKTNDHFLKKLVNQKNF